LVVILIFFIDLFHAYDVKPTFGEGYMKSGISNVLRVSNSGNISPFFGAVGPTWYERVGSFVPIGRNIDCCWLL